MPTASAMVSRVKLALMIVMRYLGTATERSYLFLRTFCAYYLQHQTVPQNEDIFDIISQSRVPIPLNNGFHYPC